MRQTKRVWQRRRNTFFALMIVLAILAEFNYIGYLISPWLCIVNIIIDLLVLEQFPWYKFK